MAEFDTLISATATGGAGFGYGGFGGDITAGGWGSTGLRVSALLTAGGGGNFGFGGVGGAFAAGGSGAFGADSFGAPFADLPVTAFGAGDFGFVAEATYYSRTYIEAIVDFGLSVTGGAFDAGGTGAFGARAYASEGITTEQNSFWLAQIPGYLNISFGFHEVNTVDVIDFDAQAYGLLAWTAASALVFDETPVFNMLNGELVTADMLRLRSSTNIVQTLVVASALTMTDSTTASLFMLLDAASALMLEDDSLDELSALLIVSSMFVMLTNAQTGRLYTDDVESTLEFTDAAGAQARALATVLSQLTLTDEVADQMTVIVATTDRLTFTDVMADVVSGTLDFADSLTFAGVMRLLGDPYTVYSVSLDNQAVTEYTNYDFNSFATSDGVGYGLGVNGLYTMDGVTDSGSDINARVRGGLNNLGTALKKHVPAVYIGYTASGRLVLKVITTDNGQKKANWYSLRPIPKTATTDGRVEPSKGLSSVYWQFEIANEDGSTFELDNVRMWRMLTNRRK